MYQVPSTSMESYITSYHVKSTQFTTGEDDRDTTRNKNYQAGLENTSLATKTSKSRKIVFSPRFPHHAVCAHASNIAAPVPVLPVLLVLVLFVIPVSVTVTVLVSPAPVPHVGPAKKKNSRTKNGTEFGVLSTNAKKKSRRQKKSTMRDNTHERKKHASRQRLDTITGGHS